MIKRCKIQEDITSRISCYSVTKAIKERYRIKVIECQSFRAVVSCIRLAVLATYHNIMHKQTDLQILNVQALVRDSYKQRINLTIQNGSIRNETQCHINELDGPAPTVSNHEQDRQVSTATKDSQRSVVLHPASRSRHLTTDYHLSPSQHQCPSQHASIYRLEIKHGCYTHYSTINVQQHNL